MGNPISCASDSDSKKSSILSDTFPFSISSGLAYSLSNFKSSFLYLSIISFVLILSNSLFTSKDLSEVKSSEYIEDVSKPFFCKSFNKLTVLLVF